MNNKLVPTHCRHFRKINYYFVVEKAFWKRSRLFHLIRTSSISRQNMSSWVKSWFDPDFLRRIRTCLVVPRRFWVNFEYLNNLLNIIDIGKLLLRKHQTTIVFHFYCIRDWQISSEKSSDSCLQKVKTCLRNCVAWYRIETRNFKWLRVVAIHSCFRSID